MSRRYAIIEAPTISGLAPTGVEELPQRLLACVLQTALASDRAIGMEIAIHNPRLDEDGAAGRSLVEVLARTLVASSTRPVGAALSP